MTNNTKPQTLTHPEQNDTLLKNKGVSLCAFLDTVRVRKDGSMTVRLRIIFNRFPKYYSTKINLSLTEYQSLCDGKPRGELKEKKILIHSLLKRANDIILGMDNFSFDKFQNQFTDKRGHWDNVMTAFENHISDLKSNKQVSTASTYETTLNSLKEFKKLNHLTFSDISVHFLKDYEKWMREHGKSPTTISMYTRCIRRLYNIAIAKGMAKREQYPFGNEEQGYYQPPEVNNIKKALSKDELKLLFNYKPELGSPEEYYRDLFIFSYLGSGMNMNDIARLKRSNIHNEEIIFIRKKTSSKRKVRPIQVSINEMMSTIISKYSNPNAKTDDYLFPILERNCTAEQEAARINQTIKQCNKYLKRIALKIGINKNISTYYARHSFASILKLSGENISYISEALGHSNIKTTENYLASFDNSKRKEAQKKLLEL